MAASVPSSESFNSPLHHSMSVSCSCCGFPAPSNSRSVKIGGLWKRSQGLSRFTKLNYKHRVFILTEQALSYYGGTVDVSKHLFDYLLTALAKLGLHFSRGLLDIAHVLVSIHLLENWSMQRQDTARESQSSGVCGHLCIQSGPHYASKFCILDKCICLIKKKKKNEVNY